jgi:hypothetical protein
MAPWAKPWQKVRLVAAAGSPRLTPQISASSPAVFVLIEAVFAACPAAQVTTLDIARMMSPLFIEILTTCFSIC